MTAATKDITYATLAESIEGMGPLALTRAMVNRRRAHPARGWSDVLHDLVTSSVDAGRRLAERLASREIKVIGLCDQAYPLLLRELADPPALLFVRGPIQNLQRPSVAVVGARSCTSYGRRAAHRIAADLSRLGFVIVSGLALGIDAQAHDACLQNGTRTVAVMGSGLERIYPRPHRGLARDLIAQGGTLVSEFPPDASPMPHHFPIRNRIISGLSRAVVVVEAKQRSGSLSTARHCLDQGRELFAVPGPIHHATSLGTHGLISRGEAQLYTNPNDVLQALEPLISAAVSLDRETQVKIEDPIAQSIYARLDAFEPTSFDDLVTDLSQDAAETVRALTQLETLKLVEQVPGQRYLRHPFHSDLSGVVSHG